MAQQQPARQQTAQLPQAKGAGAPAQKLVTELKVSAHLMTLEPGVFCIFNAPGAQRVDERTGFPGVRVSVAPGASDANVEVLSFAGDGWCGGGDTAVLVRIKGHATEILITIYQREGATEPAPKLQIQQLSDGTQPAAEPAAPAARAVPSQADVANAEISAHIQRRGDVVAKLGEWMGEKGSQRWIEGFSIAPRRDITREDIEYQAVLGRGWLSPWSDGGQYCGSRGMALPILGLRVRLKGEAAQKFNVRIQATFTDGASAGPVDASRTCEAETLAPLEAFHVELVPVEAARTTEPTGPRHKPVAPRGVAPKQAGKAVTPPVPSPAKSSAAPKGPTRKPAPPAGRRR